MKKQKKKIYNAVLGLLASVFASSILLGVNSLHTADAAVMEQTVYSDDFNAETLSDNWTVNNAKISSDYASLRVQPTESSWPAHILCQGYKLEGDCRLEMQVQELPTANPSWFALSFGSPSTISIFEKASGALIFANNTTLLFKEGVDQKKDMPYSALTTEVSTVVLDFEMQKNGAYNITYTVKRGGALVGTTLIENFAVQNGYFGFNTYGVNFDVLSFDVYEGAEKVYSDNFTSSVMSYDDNVVKGAAWVALSPFTSATASIAPVGSLDISASGANAIYKDAFVKKSTEVSTLYEVSAKFDFSNAQEGVATGFEIAKATPEAEGVFVGLTRKSDAYQIILSAGDKEEKIALGGTPADGVWNVNLAANYDNSLDVTVNGFSASFDLDTSVEGYLGLITSDKYAIGVGALVDDFSFQRYIYNDSGAKDMKMNFNGTREFEDEEGKYYQYYFPMKDWYAGSNVRVANYGFTDNGYVLFGNASMDSTFGPKVKYGDCIVRFDLTMVGSDYYYDNPEGYYNPLTGVGACEAECFGLQFGSKSYKNIYINAQSLGIATYNAKSVYYTTNCVRASGSDAIYRPNTAPTAENAYDLFRKGASYNFMYVIKNGTVSMHFKEANEDESVLGIVREYVTGVDTNGYLAVYGANGVDFRLDNFSVTNLDRTYASSEYTGDSDLKTLRVDVTNGDDLSAFNMTANTLTTKGVTGSNITRVTLGAVNSFSYKQGSLEIAFTNDGAKVTDGVNIKEIAFDKPLLIRGATLEITRINDMVSVGFANAGAPLTAIDDNTYSVSGLKAAGREQIVLTANGGLEVEKIAIFNLDSKVDITPRNFDAEIDVMQPWVVRETIQGKGVDIWVWVLIGVGAAVAVATPVVVILIRKKKNEKDKME